METREDKRKVALPLATAMKWMGKKVCIKKKRSRKAKGSKFRKQILMPHFVICFGDVRRP